MAKAVTVRSGKQGKHELRLVQQGATFTGLADGKILVSGEDADTVWASLLGELGKLDPKYFGFGGAKTRFLSIFPASFADPGYAGHERDYKDKARAKLLATVSPEAAAESSGMGEAVLSVFRATNLLSTFEQIRIQEVLRGRNADAFIRAAGRFTVSCDATSLKAMAAALEPHAAATWPVVTYLPYLWAPDRHMFLKPTVTHDFAARVGHPFRDVYASQVGIEVYESLLDLAARTEAEIADLKPRGRIDLQSFIWVIGAYDDPKDAAAERFPDPDVFVVKPEGPVSAS